MNQAASILKFSLLSVVVAISNATGLLSAAAIASPLDAVHIPEDTKLSAINCAIVHKEIELEKSNAQFLFKSHPEGRWKAWRYFLFQETGGALIEGGLVAGIADRYRQMDHGGKIPGVLLENSFVPQMIGQFVAAAGDVVELGLNARLALLATVERRDAATAKRVACQMHNDLLRLLDQRDLLLKNSSQLSTNLSKLETRILRDEERLVWLQYSRSLHNARLFAATENTFYTLDILKNLTGAAGNIVSLAATSSGRPKLNIGANTLTTISGALIMSDPVTSRLVGKIVAKIHGRDLDSNYRQELTKVVASLTQNSDAMNEAYKNLLSENGPENRVLSTRVNLYSKHAERAGRFVADQKAKDRKANTGALNNMVVAALTGGTKVAAGTCGIIAADRLSDHAGAAVLLGGTSAYATGTDIALFDNLRINVIRERRFDLQSRSKTSAKDVLVQEIHDLDILDKQLTACECAQSVE